MLPDVDSHRSAFSRQLGVEFVAEQGVEDEIRVLRVVMSRLMVEEEDLSKLVAGTARLTTAIVQASRLQRLIASTERDPFDEAMNRARE